MGDDRELQKRVLALETLLDLSQSFNLFVELEELGNFLLLTLMGQFSFSRAALFLERQESHGELYALTGRGVDWQRLQPITLSWHRGIGRMLLEAKGGFISLEGGRDRESVSNTLGDELGFRLGVPLAAKSRSLGIILLGERVHREAITELDDQMLASTIEIAATAIENSLLYKSLRRSNEELIQKNVRLQEMDRLKSEFLQNTGHELRTPLTCILSYAECLRSKSVDDATRVEFSGHVVDQGQKLLSMIENLLALSSLSSDSLVLREKAFDLNRLLEEEARKFQDESQRKQQSMRLSLPPDSKVAELDEGRTREIVRCLLDNAVKFTPRGGKIEISAGNTVDGVVIRVRDSGIGIAPQDHAMIFERFRQVDGSTTRAYGGFGIGLSLAKELAELQGGRITVESHLGGGSLFTLTLPTPRGAPSAAAVS